MVLFQRRSSAAPALLRPARPAQVLESIALNVCAGCTFLHEAKPPIVVGLSPRVVVLDGYLAAMVRVLPRRLGGSGSAAPTTPRDVYTAPELLAGAGEEVGGTLAADIYAFSMLLFQLFCRAEPFIAQASSPPGARRSQLQRRGELRLFPEGWVIAFLAACHHAGLDH